MEAFRCVIPYAHNTPSSTLQWNVFKSPRVVKPSDMKNDSSKTGRVMILFMFIYTRMERLVRGLKLRVKGEGNTKALHPYIEISASNPLASNPRSFCYHSRPTAVAQTLKTQRLSSSNNEPITARRGLLALPFYFLSSIPVCPLVDPGNPFVQPYSSNQENDAWDMYLVLYAFSLAAMKKLYCKCQLCICRSTISFCYRLHFAWNILWLWDCHLALPRFMERWDVRKIVYDGYRVKILLEILLDVFIKTKRVFQSLHPSRTHSAVRSGYQVVWSA